MRLENKNALVTGGRQGIGRAIVEAFVREGATVVTCGRGERPADLSDGIHWVTTDVSDSDSVMGLRDFVAETLGSLDIVVNNSGIQIEKTLPETTDDDWDALMGVNAKGVFLVCRAFIPALRPGASIINIGSTSATSADHGLAIYNASKAFVLGLTRSIAVDHGPDIRCNAICPGWILTDMAEAAFAVAGDPKAAEQDALRRHPVGRFGSPDDIAGLAVWLASDEARFATGQCYTLDGGLTAASPINPTIS